ncbi:MAG: hypothetical protein HY741_15475 [Chloroflexi bacterium]|nr:hypothetical protein [Chloroflexota bacterium]
MDILFLLLRVIHIFASVFWVGSAWLLTFFLGPAAQALGPDGGKFMGLLTTRYRLPIYISIAAGLTVLAGLIMYFIWYGIAALGTPDGLTFAIGGVIGLVAAGIGGGLVGPTSLKIARLGEEMARAGKPPAPGQIAEMNALQKRLSTASLWSAIFVSLSLLLMAIARYV